MESKVSHKTPPNVAPKPVHVPKFNSFNPKTAFYRQVQALKENSSEESKIPESRQSKVNKERDSSRSKSVDLPSLHSAKVSEPTQKTSSVKLGGSAPERAPTKLVESRHLIFIDSIGDPENSKYGRLHSHTIPFYFRAGGGEILGSSKRYRLDRAGSNNKFTVLSNTLYPSSSKYERARLSRFASVGEKKIRAKPLTGDASFNLAADFVPISTFDKEENNKKGYEAISDFSPYSGLDGSHPHNPTGWLIHRDDEPGGEDFAYHTDASASDYDGGESHFLTTAMQRKLADLSKKVDIDPTDYDSWIDLIDCQGITVNVAHPDKLSKAERESISETKISIYAKAIESMQNWKDKERLLVGMMEEGCNVWESKRLSSKWHSMLRKYPTSWILWKKYLDFKQTDFSSFKYEEVRASYLESLDVLRQTRMQLGLGLAANETIYAVQVYIMLRMMVFSRESGFSEHALASWQAIIEYVFFKPVEFQRQESQPDGSLKMKALSAFQGFWETELPRMGEDHAAGWANTMQSRGSLIYPRKDVEDHSSDDRQNFHKWEQIERRKSLQARTPARALDKTVEDDPYRVVLFSDIRNILDDPPARSGGELLVAALLAFCHLPPYPINSAHNVSRSWWRESYLRNEDLSQSHDLVSNWRFQVRPNETDLPSLNRVHHDSPKKCPSMKSPFRFCKADFQISSDTLFASRDSWFSVFDSWEDECSKDQGPVEVAWVRRIIRALVHVGVGGEILAQYHLALELRFSPSDVRKTAKTLIKSRPSSISLYNSYALVEYRLGNAESAENVITTTINMSKSLNDQAQRESIFLWSTWVWELLGTRQPAVALARLLSFPNVTPNPNLECTLQDLPPPGASQLLRAQKALTAARDHAMSLGFQHQVATVVECLIIFIYLSTQFSLSAAHMAFTSNFALISTQCPSYVLSQELIRQSFARLLYHHVESSRDYSPSVIRSFFAESVAQFPLNTMFLSLYSWIEGRFRLDDRVRSIMRHVLLDRNRNEHGEQQGSVIGHFFAIHTEIHRGVTLGSNVHAVRGTFERAVASRNGAHSAGLWKLYFLFEISRNDLNRAKSVFYRGLRFCPWAKALYMLAFEYLRPVMHETELRGLYELMGEKELRIHVSFGDGSDTEGAE